MILSMLFSPASENRASSTISSNDSPICRTIVSILGQGTALPSPTPIRYSKQGWNGFCAEVSKGQFYELSYLLQQLPHDVICTNNHITPENVNRILSANDVPQEIGFLSLDIDSYDYYVLEALLEHYRPALICTEITEVIPPPIKFALKYSKEVSGPLVGQSISMVSPLLNKHDYSLNQIGVQ